MRRERLWAIRVGGLCAAAVVAAVLTGCAAEQKAEEQVDAAREVNATFKTAVGEVQLQILDDEWDVGEYGDIPHACDPDEYRFRMDRSTPQDWRIGTDALDAANELGAWMKANGWTDIAVRTYSGDVDDVTLKARRLDAHVDEIAVDFQPGDVMDFATVRAESTCEQGDADALTAALVPGWPTSPPAQITRPATERPDATPVFGFGADGQPR